MTNLKTSVIIGGGLGGLFCGALLAKQGVQVTVLEKNAIAGGGLQCFKRNGVSYETGMHLVSGFQEGGSLNRICKYLGIMDRLRLQPMPADAMDSVIYIDNEGKPTLSYNLPQGREAFADYLKQQFPAEAEGIDSYMKDMYEMTDTLDLYHLRPTSVLMLQHPWMYRPVDEFIAHHVKDPRLREILAHHCPMYGGKSNSTPAYIHAAIQVLYIDGSQIFVGGSQQLADALTDCICQNGGKVLAGDAVSHVEVESRKVLWVETKSGKRYEGDNYISDIHPVSLFNLCAEGTFQKSFTNRLRSIPNTYSSFTVFFHFKPGMEMVLNRPIYVLREKASVWDMYDYSSRQDKNLGAGSSLPWPVGFLMVTPPGGQNTLSAVSPMQISECEEWADSRVGHRPEAYRAWKEKRIEAMTEAIARIYPDFKNRIDSVFGASPLTIRDFYNVPEGSMYGFRKDTNNIFLSNVSARTKVENLYLTGQNIGLHGICGVPLTAIKTVESILGKDSVLQYFNPSESGQTACF